MAAVSAVDATSIDWVTLIVGMAGGLALFLFGMDRMTEALRTIAGNRAKAILGKLTANRVFGLVTGAGMTALVQSSSVTTVLLVGFVSAGLMTFVQAIPVIFGANIGSTVTAQLIAFNVTTVSLVFIAAGFVFGTLARRESHRAQGRALLGLGLMFFGMVVMSDAMSPLRSYQPFIDAMATLDNLFLGILVGALFTGVIQSSAATAGVVIVLSGLGLISLEAGIAIVLGANIGTSVTALLAAIGKPRDAQRTAVAHLLFNVLGVLIWIPFVGFLVSLVDGIGGGIPREIANAHTIFNVFNALLFLPFVMPFARLVERWVPDKTPKDAISPHYIDLGLLKTPQLALAKARMEMMRMASRVQNMLVKVLPAMIDGTVDELGDIEALDDEVDALHGIIVEYLGRVSQEALSNDSSAELVDLLEATNALEAIGDIIETNLIGLGRQRIESSIEVSRGTRDLIEAYHRSVVEALDYALVAVTQKDIEAARGVAGMKSTVKQAELEALQRESERLIVGEPNRVATYRFEVDVIANLKRIFYFARRIARVAVPDLEQAVVGSDEPPRTPIAT
jgi:phosphate:Na+ symporter